MRRALRFSALLLGMLAISSHVDARGGGGGGFGGSFGGGFSRGFMHVAPSDHVMSGFNRQSIVRRRVFAGRHLNALGRRQFFGQTGSLIGGDYWWPDWWPSDSQIAEYSPAPEPPSQPQIIIIHPDDKGATVADAAPDDGYIPGCHAILNGYHCDTGSSAH